MIIWTMRRRDSLHATNSPNMLALAVALPAPSPAAQAILDLFR